jgi:hypothetical protein
LLAAVGAAVLFGGCDNPPAPPVLPPPGEVPEVVLETPEDAARSVLACLQTELRARAHQDESVANACLEKLRSAVAAQSLAQTIARMPQFKPALGDDVVEGFIHNWGAAIAYYAEGLHLEQMRRSASSGSVAAVVVPASGAEDDALIQLTCQRGSDDLWRVSRIEFVTEAPSRPVTSQPRSEPASRPRP